MTFVIFLKFFRPIKILLLGLVISQISIGCASTGKSIVAGMTAGAVAGAGVGSQFYYRGETSVQTQNAIIGAGIGALIVGGFLSWHYRSIEKELEQVSGQFARSRICDPDGLGGMGTQSSTTIERSCTNHLFSKDQVGESAIELDDNTKWALPQFRKRYMQPENDEDKVISERYLWEIIKPGSFVTRSQNSEYFLQTEVKKDPKNEGKSKLNVNIELKNKDQDSIKEPPQELPTKNQDLNIEIED